MADTGPLPSDSSNGNMIVLDSDDDCVGINEECGTCASEQLGESSAERVSLSD